MKMMHLIVFAIMLLSGYRTAAQEVATEVVVTQKQDSIPAYAYCEIIGSHVPTPLFSSVLIDFGQQASTFSYNKLQNAQGQKYVFNSMIEALNFMVRQDWEFVQAYSSGEDNNYTHYLLKIPVSKLNPEQLSQWNSEPKIKADNPKKRK